MSNQTPSRVKKDTKFFWFVGAIFSALYLLNPTMGFDAVPDILPVVGNMDEAAATFFLLFCLNRLGISLPFSVQKGNSHNKGRVIDI